MCTVCICTCVDYCYSLSPVRSLWSQPQPWHCCVCQKWVVFRDYCKLKTTNPNPLNTSASLSCIAASVLVFKFIHNVLVNVANFFGAGGKHQLTLKNMCEKGRVEYWVSAWTRSMLPRAMLKCYCGYCLNGAQYVVLTWYLRFLWLFSISYSCIVYVNITNMHSGGKAEVCIVSTYGGDLGCVEL